MPLHASYIGKEGRLELRIDGNLDISVTQGICDVCRRASPRLTTCIVDLSGVDRVFDSGIALLQMLHRRLSALGTIVVFLTDDPRICGLIPICRSPAVEPTASASP
jgi:ABC-type transporter Mla MlaB component